MGEWREEEGQTSIHLPYLIIDIQDLNYDQLLYFQFYEISWNFSLLLKKPNCPSSFLPQHLIPKYDPLWSSILKFLSLFFFLVDSRITQVDPLLHLTSLTTKFDPRLGEMDWDDLCCEKSVLCVPIFDNLCNPNPIYINYWFQIERNVSPKTQFSMSIITPNNQRIIRCQQSYEKWESENEKKKRSTSMKSSNW